MDSVILLGLRIALLIALWLFILFALNTLRKDAATSSGKGKLVPILEPRLPARTSSQGNQQVLHIIEGPLQGSHLSISGLSEVTIGRTADCTFTVGDDYASARHARLFQRGNEWFIEDLDSRNGTYVDGYRIDQPEKISANQDIKIGRTILRLGA
ncbi:FHA-domain-containing protein [Corynebacterium kutscheri]|uniref:FHA-domain-containing protein n=1 Tax=Corynebacterium kutscheri TaxID=35755 RepID=A0A0F6R080_9CORY|nr:FHA domain-containing protein [Corynebacterium kutscheri]AKE40278.1 FHA domain-containing protein [Corynebacterium kutscheri]VEH05530.1 FHA-domain-containing protein [Corynebacterium kutscheri]VEH10670.1 FHA-domain-containing protein [Corynebacterium kutscheri]VEH81424.1 FHA-domain-containing protein [Corynebacterium kutscheri]